MTNCSHCLDRANRTKPKPKPFFFFSPLQHRLHSSYMHCSIVAHCWLCTCVHQCAYDQCYKCGWIGIFASVRVHFAVSFIFYNISHWIGLDWIWFDLHSIRFYITTCLWLSAECNSNRNLYHFLSLQSMKFIKRCSWFCFVFSIITMLHRIKRHFFLIFISVCEIFYDAIDKCDFNYLKYLPTKRSAVTISFYNNRVYYFNLKIRLNLIIRFANIVFLTFNLIEFSRNEDAPFQMPKHSLQFKVERKRKKKKHHKIGKKKNENQKEMPQHWSATHGF